MIQCETCEFCQRGVGGAPELSCDPFSTIKEPECLAKWHLVKLTHIAESHRATLRMHERFAPLQERMFQHIEREIDEAEEADGWKYTDEDAEDDLSHYGDDGDDDEAMFRL